MQKSRTDRRSYLRAYRRRKRAQLVKFLGGCCVDCLRAGRKNTRKLQVDHINGTSWDVSAVSWDTRLRWYWEEAREGLIQLLCETCNKAKVRPDHGTPF